MDIAKDVDVKDAYILGPVLVLDKVMEQYGIYPTLQHIAQQHPKLSYNFPKAVFLSFYLVLFSPFLNFLCMIIGWINFIPIK
jgi:hypothetical protein